MDPSTPAGGDFLNQLVFNLHNNLPLNQTPDSSTSLFNALPVNTTLPQGGPAKKRASFTACAACQSKHCACDEQRPCSRCVRLRIICTDGVPRKGKTKKKPQKEATNIAPPSDPYVVLERELLAGKYPSGWVATSQLPTIPLPEPLNYPSTPFTPSAFPNDPTAANHPLSFDFLATTIPLPEIYDLDSDANIISLSSEINDTNPVPTPYASQPSPYPPQPTPYPSTPYQVPSPYPHTPSQSTTPAQPTPPSDQSSPSSSSPSPSSSSDSYNPFAQSRESLQHRFVQAPALAALSVAQSSLHPFSSSSIPTDPILAAPTHAAPSAHAITQQNSSPAQGDTSNAAVLGLQQELQELRRELAAVRHRDRIAFPLHQRVMPKDVATTMWSLNDGTIIDYSAGFLKLLNYTAQSADKLTFYDISPHATRAQRRHLLAYFLRERPEVNGVVTYKSILHSTGSLLDVLCTSTVYYFEDAAIIQLVFFKP